MLKQNKIKKMKSNRFHISDLNTKNTLMKTLKINKIILLLIGFVVFNGCVQDDDFNTPNLSIEEPNIPASQIRTLASLGGDLAQEQSSNDDIFDPQPLDYSNEADTVSYVFSDTDQYVVGYVVSSDEAGNYFEELIIQDKPENPTIGIKLLIDVNPLFTKYDVGRKVYIKISGLSVGIRNGVLTLGTLNGDQVDKIPSQFETEFIKRSEEVTDIVALPIDIAEFTESKTNLLIKLDNVQFKKSEVIDNSLTYASESFDQYDGERTLQSCSTGASTIFSTSTFADFKGLALPSGNGSLTAVLSRNYEGNNFVVSVNTPEDVSLTSSERCDLCSTPSGGGNVFYSEDFEGFNGYNSEGWTNINVSGTSTDWFISGFSGNNYSRISAYNSGNSEANVWLVTPTINMDSTSGEELSFDVQASYDNGTILRVLISNDFNGDVLTANWIPIFEASIPSGPGNTFGDFETVGPVNISCLEGNINIAFLYEGSDPDATTRYHIDNVEVTGN